jgi:hypothetical protein
MFDWLFRLLRRTSQRRPTPLPELDISQARPGAIITVPPKVRLVAQVVRIPVRLTEDQARKAGAPIAYVHRPMRRRDIAPATAAAVHSSDADIPLPWPFMASDDRSPSECAPPEPVADIEPPAVDSGGGGDFSGGGASADY